MMALYGLLLAALAAAMGGGGSSDTTAAAARTEDDGDSDAGAPAAPVIPEDDAPEPVAEEVVRDEPLAAPIAESPTVVSSGTDVPDLPDSAYDIGWAGLSGEEQLIVELINRARLDPRSEEIRLDEVLADGISRSPVEALAVVPTLSDAAEAHSEDMDDREFFAHEDPDGGLPWDRAVEAGHSNTFVGENIGLIWGGTVTDEQARAEWHHKNLWESDGHQANLMGGSWSEIGLGYDYGDHNGSGGATFATELFGDTGKSYLTGVVIEDDDGDGFYDMGEGQGDVRITAFNDEDTFATATWDAGGYSLALPPGTYKVVFEGGDLDAPYETEVTIGDENVKLDVIDEGGATVMSLSAAPEQTEAQTMMATLMLDAPDDEPLPVDEVEEIPELALI